MLIDPIEKSSEAVSAIIEANGKIATEMQFDSFRTMTIEDFVKYEVPKLKSGPAEGSFSYYVLRDLSNGKYSTIMPDGVTQMHVTSLTDVPLETLCKKLISASRVETEEIIFNTTVPIYSYSQGKDRWELSLKMPETPMFLHHTSGDHKIFLPPTVYTVSASSGTNNILYTKIKVLIEDSLDADKVMFGHLPFPNVHADTQICTGTSRLSDRLSSEELTCMSPMQVVARCWGLLMSSNWNQDLSGIAEGYMPYNLRAVYRKYYPDGHEYDHFQQLLRVLSVKGRWGELQWHKI